MSYSVPLWSASHEFPPPIDLGDLLNPFQHFGVNLGLERIIQLLHRLGDPHLQVPIVHVGGTNGKGSVCAYLSTVLTHAGYRVGRYTSPHLVSWAERIQINGRYILSDTLKALLQETIASIHPSDPTPTIFEILTAAAWLHFAQEKVDLAIMEVGLGGRLDATNVSDRPLATVITSISREHWQVLGSTLAAIAGEKAGILKSDCPAILGDLPPEAKTVVAERIQALNCPAHWVERASPVAPESWSDRGFSFPKNSSLQWLEYQSQVYPIQLAGTVQHLNSALAMETLNTLKQRGWAIPDRAIQEGMAATHWPGRLQWITWNGADLLLDGAHNPAAALHLREYLDHSSFRSPSAPIHWVMGMLSTKDHSAIFQALLRPNDRLYLVPVPDHSHADLEELANLARSVQPNLAECQIYPDLFLALPQALALNASPPEPSNLCTVLCGSLYLLGHFFQIRSR